MTLYLIDKSKIYRLPMSADVQVAVEIQLQNQYLAFTTEANYDDAGNVVINEDTQEVEYVAFQGSYKVQKGELNYIDDYNLPDDLQTALDHAVNIEVLDLNQEIQPKAIMADITIDGKKVIVFQKLDSRQVSDLRYSLEQVGEEFKRLTNPVVTLQTRLDAAWVNDRLLFFSFPKIRSFLPVVEYYEKATDADVGKFIGDELFTFSDEEKFKKSLSSLTRKKMKMIQDNKILENTSPKRILKQSKKYKITIEVDKDGKIIFPKDPAQCKKIISFLNEEYATSVLTKRQIRMNSKEYLPKK